MNRPTLISSKWRARYAARRLAEFTGRCRERGLAITPQRVAVMRVLVNSGEHPRAETVFARVCRKFPNISLATVHRTLETLCTIGEARKVTPLHDSARYDGNTAPHHHLVCVRCRKVCDIDVPQFNQLLRGRHSLGEFQLLGCSVEVHGVCKACRMPGAKRQARSTFNHSQRRLAVMKE
jgi:Fur family transcriptional regulator, peroxide stress response regulator